MSNAMSRTKSRWKGALLATAATAVLSPLAAKAQSLTVGITTNPLGSGPQSSVYIDPYDTDKLYVYATVTGTSAPSASYVDGLDYLYYNVNAVSSVSGIGSITAATPSTLFGGNAFNQSNTAPGAGAQGGAISAIGATPSIVVGSNTSLGSIAKPRGAGDVYVSGVSGSQVLVDGIPTTEGTNVVVSGNSVSFLVETLTYTPSSAAVLANPSTPAAPVSLSFNVSTPSASLFTPTTNYTPDNYFVGMPGIPGTSSYNLSPGASNTSTGYSASVSGVKLTDALAGDANLDGTVNFTDFSTLLQNYGKHLTTGWTASDFNEDGVVNFTDFSNILQNYNLSLGSSPSVTLASQQAELSAIEADLAAVGNPSAVPEPASLGLLALFGVGTLARRRRV